MPHTQQLNQILSLHPHGNEPLVMVYDENSNPARLHYTCRFIFNHVLKCAYTVTSNRQHFDNYSECKINYSGANQYNCLNIGPCGLLTETTVRNEKPKPYFAHNNIYFFNNKAQGFFHFDIFSAVFYFISRLEEWQGFEADEHGRFEATASLLYKNNFHLRPVVDLWIHELKETLETQSRKIKFSAPEFKVISTIDVDNLYAYKAKGPLRSAAAIIKDALKLNLSNIKQRIKVLAGQKDPFDIYDETSRFCKENEIPLIFFFLFRSGTRFDRAVNPSSSAFIKVMNTVKGLGALTGLHPSYNAAYQHNLLQEEMTRFSRAAKHQTTLSRQHYLRFDIKSTPHLLLKMGITADFSMGFASAPGFRAGTSHPFYYYNFKEEREENLLFVPFCVMDGAYFVYAKQNPESSLQSMLALACEIKQTGGYFISVFHERTFSNHLYKGFGALYKKLHTHLKRPINAKN